MINLSAERVEFGFASRSLPLARANHRLAVAPPSKSARHRSGVQISPRQSKIHPEWFETPHSESNRGKNEVDYSIK